MGRKKGKKTGSGPGGSPRRGMRRSIRTDAYEEGPEDRLKRLEYRHSPKPPEINLRMMRADAALTFLESKLCGLQREGRAEALVIHGKGHGSAGGISVLGPLVRQWCNNHPELVARWEEAPAFWGGAGGIVVTLN